MEAAETAQGSQLRALRTLVGATVFMTGVMVLTKAFVDARIPRPPPKPGKQKSSQKKKKHGSFSESLQVGRSDPARSCLYLEAGAGMDLAAGARGLGTADRVTVQATAL